MGIRRISDIADAAYIASRAATYEDCKGIDPKHVWDDGRPREGESEDVIGEWLAGALRRYDTQVEHHSHLIGVDYKSIGRQKDLVFKIEFHKKQNLHDRANEWDLARLKGVAAPKAGMWLEAPPDRNLGLRLSNAEVRSRVSRRLGKEICEEGPCPLCFGVMDRWGVHAESCMSGGDKTIVHHCTRNSIKRQCRLANFGPQLEKGIDRMLGLDSDGKENDRGRERPADVLLVQARDVCTGSGERVDGKVALDVAVVCPQAAGHRSSAASESLGAAEDYVRHKCSRADMEVRCRNAGVAFQPMVF